MPRPSASLILLAVPLLGSSVPCAIPAAPRGSFEAVALGAPGPELWLATSGMARVYILGFGEARDTSWLTPRIQRAFETSDDLWLETSGASAAEGLSASERQVAAARMDRLGRQSGRSLFDVLEPSVARRTRGYVAELGIDPDSIRLLRPWRAYYSIVRAFWSGRPPSYHQVDVDVVLGSMARAAGKRVDHEFPTREAFTTFMALMPDAAQSQYIEWLLDFLDDYKRGLNDSTESFSWIGGRPGDAPLRSLERMRTRMPDLYRVMQPERNRWWARTIFELLGTKGTHFVAIGQLHVLGPDGLPEQLARLGVELRLAD